VESTNKAPRVSDQNKAFPDQFCEFDIRGCSGDHAYSQLLFHSPEDFKLFVFEVIEATLNPSIVGRHCLAHACRVVFALGYVFLEAARIANPIRVVGQKGMRQAEFAIHILLHGLEGKQLKHI
jgi:hypothetical protein